MLGAIIGDIVGSRFEFHNYRNKSFDLLEEDCFFTDDTVMTCAVADALINKKDIVHTLQTYGRTFPFSGYGGSFLNWIYNENPRPYDSYGNGAAMRISPVAYIATSEAQLKRLVNKVTEITHSHPEGIKGAETVAMCVFKALHGATKEEIAKYATRKYPEIASFNYMELNHHYRYNESCQKSVPQAIYCFLISQDFDDCLKTTVSIGGDSDTLCAISGAIAEAYYGLPKKYKTEILPYFKSKKDKTLLQPIVQMYKQFGGIVDIIKI